MLLEQSRDEQPSCSVINCSKLRISCCFAFFLYVCDFSFSFTCERKNSQFSVFAAYFLQLELIWGPLLLLSKISVDGLPALRSSFHIFYFNGCIYFIKFYLECELWARVEDLCPQNCDGTLVLSSSSRVFPVTVSIVSIAVVTRGRTQSVKNVQGEVMCEVPPRGLEIMKPAESSWEDISEVKVSKLNCWNQSFMHENHWHFPVGGDPGWFHCSGLSPENEKWNFTNTKCYTSQKWNTWSLISQKIYAGFTSSFSYPFLLSILVILREI